MEYETLLKNAPAQETPAFVGYLRENNQVVFEYRGWMAIKNAKREGWITVFSVKTGASLDDFAVAVRAYGFGEWEWRKHSKRNQSVPDRFHIHLVP